MISFHLMSAIGSFSSSNRPLHHLLVEPVRLVLQPVDLDDVLESPLRFSRLLHAQLQLLGQSA